MDDQPKTGLEKLTELTAKLISAPYSALDRTFDLSPDLLCILDDKGTFLKTSKSWTTELGWSQAELCSNPWVFFLHPEDIAPSLACYEEVTKTGNPTSHFVNRYRCKDNSYKTLVWSLPGTQDGTAFSIARIQK